MKKSIEMPIEFEFGDTAWLVKGNSVECMKITRIEMRITKSKREIFYGDYIEEYGCYKHGIFQISDLFHTKEQALAELESRFRGLIVQAEIKAEEEERRSNEDKH